jgi:isoleucyl-tRNA synthetase
VRTDNQLKVRQPLMRADVVVSSSDRAARLEVYRNLIAEELNVREVRWLLPGEEGDAVAYDLKPNFRALGPRLGKRVQAVKQALLAADCGALRTELAANGAVVLNVDGEALTLDTSELSVAVVAAEGFAAAGGKSGVVVLHTALDDDLLDEGLAREVLSQLQSQRKKLALGYTDRIVVKMRGGERLQRVVQQYRAHIEKEALCAEVQLGDGDAESDWSSATAQGELFHFRVDPV